MEDTAKTKEELIKEGLEEATDEQMESEVKNRDLELKKLDEYGDDELIDKIHDRSLEHHFKEECEKFHVEDHFELAVTDQEKLELFISHMDMIDLDQWRHQFKQIARLPKEMQKKLPEEYTNILNQFA